MYFLLSFHLLPFFLTPSPFHACYVGYSPAITRTNAKSSVLEEDSQQLMLFHSNFFLILLLTFLLNFPFISYSLFNSSFSHQFLTSQLKSPIFVSLLFPCLVLSFPSPILPSFISGLFHKLLLLPFTLSHLLFVLSFFLFLLQFYTQFPVTFSYNTSLPTLSLPSVIESQNHLGCGRPIMSSNPWDELCVS